MSNFTIVELIEKFQCPGCVCGSDIKCSEYNYDDEMQRCTAHVLGTMAEHGNSFALGLPKGFCKPGIDWAKNPPRSHNKMFIRLWIAKTKPEWDRFNVPVWALEKEGFLFVRTFAPRVNISWVDVIEDGSLNLVTMAINVGDFINEID